MKNETSSITTNNHEDADNQIPSPSSLGGVSAAQDSVSPPNSPSNRQQVNIRGRWTHNPVVLAALACSNMSSCEEVKEMYHEW
jgi:hypothetical protein